MALQHLVTFSSAVDGAGIAAGSPYGCGGQGFSWTWIKLSCYNGIFFRLWWSYDYIEDYTKQGLIDDPVNLRDKPMVLFNGLLDPYVSPLSMLWTRFQMRHYVHDNSKITSVFNTSAAHVWSVDHGKCKCGDCLNKPGQPDSDTDLCCNVNNCNYDFSGDILRRTYGEGVKPRVTVKPRFHWIPQWRYVPANHSSSNPHGAMMPWFVVYVPSSCELVPASCKVHVNYHGCTPRTWNDRLMWIRNLDLNEYGEANGIIIVYPQAAGNPDIAEGCWDWMPYNNATSGNRDPNFDTNKGAQLGTVSNILQDLDNAVKRAHVVKRDELLPDELLGSQVPAGFDIADLFSPQLSLELLV